jgi:hypothetical protein
MAQKTKAVKAQAVKPAGRAVKAMKAPPKAKPEVKPMASKIAGKVAIKAPVKAPAPVAKPGAAKETPLIAKAKAALEKEKTASNKTAPAVKPEGKGKGKKISIDINPNEAASALSQKWITLNKKAEQIETKPYNMKQVFEEKTAIVHKVLGWGYILANRNDRLEVLFKDGIKYLISNYKP